MQAVPHIDWLPERQSISYSSTTLRLMDGVAKQARPTTVHARSTRSSMRPTRLTRTTRQSTEVIQQKTAPNWMGEAGHKIGGALRGWSSQAWAVTQTPRRFARHWAAGKREALNPLAFFAIGSVIALACERGARALIGLPSQHGLQGWLNGCLGQMLSVIVLGALMHLTLRHWSKARFGTSLGAVLFAVGGPGVLCLIPGWAATILLHLRGAAVPQFTTPVGVTLPVPVLAASLFGLAWMLGTTAGVAGVRCWRSSVAFIASIGTVGFVCGTIEVAVRLLT